MDETYSPTRKKDGKVPEKGQDDLAISLDRTTRPGRGKNMRTLMKEDNLLPDEDEDVQGFFGAYVKDHEKNEEGDDDDDDSGDDDDDEFDSSEGEEEDSDVDSDFDGEFLKDNEDEESVDIEEKNGDLPEKKKNRLKYIDPALKKKQENRTKLKSSGISAIAMHGESNKRQKEDFDNVYEKKEFSRPGRGKNMRTLMKEANLLPDEDEDVQGFFGTYIKDHEKKEEGDNDDDELFNSSGGEEEEDSDVDSEFDGEFLKDSEDEDFVFDIVDDQLQIKPRQKTYSDPCIMKKKKIRKGDEGKDVVKPPTQKRTYRSRFTPRFVRASTRKNTEISAEKRRREQQAAKERVKISRPSKRIMTQEERLEEAKTTEEINLLSVQKMLEKVEEIKRQSIKREHIIEVPKVSYLSRKGIGNVLLFSDPADIPFHNTNQPKKPDPGCRVCSITGKYARYKDPLTGIPFANVAAFKKIRTQYLENQAKLTKNRKRHQKNVDIILQYDKKRGVLPCLHYPRKIYNSYRAFCKKSPADLDKICDFYESLSKKKPIITRSHSNIKIIASKKRKLRKKSVICCK